MHIVATFLSEQQKDTVAAENDYNFSEIDHFLLSRYINDF